MRMGIIIIIMMIDGVRAVFRYGAAQSLHTSQGRGHGLGP